MRLALGLGLPPGGGGAAFSPLSLVPFAWYDPSDLTTLFQDAAMTTPVTAADDPVGAMLDKSGNGHHLTQATADNRPLYKTSGGLHWLEFDGGDSLASGTLTRALPRTRVSAWRPTGGVTTDGYWFFSCRSDDRKLELIRNFDVLNRVSISNGGGFVHVASGAAIDTDYVYIEKYDDDGSGELGVDDSAYQSGTVGADPGSDITLGTLSASGILARFYGAVECDYIVPDPEIALLRTYLAAKQGRVL